MYMMYGRCVFDCKEEKKKLSVVKYKNIAIIKLFDITSRVHL